VISNEIVLLIILISEFMWIPISVDKFVKIHLQKNPNENEKVLRVRLEAASNLCLTCLKNVDPDQEEELLCNLTRNDQASEKVFKCYAYEKL
jgi:hypothetical protein